MMLYVFDYWQNPSLFHAGWFVESLFIRTLITSMSLKEANVLVEKWCLGYNTFRPHGLLNYRPQAPAVNLHSDKAEL